MWLPLLMPAVAAASARPLAARLEPREATWLLAGASVALAASSSAALALVVASAVAGSPLLAALGHYSGQVVRRGDPTPAVAGAVAVMLLAAAAVATVVAARSRGRALAESYSRAARMGTDRAVVVVPGPGVEAYALPGWPGRIVVSGRLLSALDERGRAALLAHERAHLSGRHHLFTTAALLAAAANPLLVPVARAVDYTVERWADEHAARATGDRRLVAATIAQVALLAGPRRRRLPAASFGIGGDGARRRVSLAWAGPVPRRVAALLAPPPSSRLPLVAAAVVTVALAGASAFQAARDLHALLELAGAIH